MKAHNIESNFCINIWWFWVFPKVWPLTKQMALSAMAYLLRLAKMAFMKFAHMAGTIASHAVLTFFVRAFFFLELYISTQLVLMYLFYFIFICRDWSLYVEAWNDLQSGESHPSIDEGHDPTGAVIDVWPWWRGLMGVEMEIEIECAGFKIERKALMYVYIYIYSHRKYVHIYKHTGSVLRNQSSKRSQRFVGTRCMWFSRVSCLQGLPLCFKTLPWPPGSPELPHYQVEGENFEDFFKQRNAKMRRSGSMDDGNGRRWHGKLSNLKPLWENTQAQAHVCFCVAGYPPNVRVYFVVPIEKTLRKTSANWLPPTFCFDMF